MMREVPKVRQIPNEPRRRWFVGEFFELIVWFGTRRKIVGFQLCYDPQGKPRALTWLEDRGFTHDGIHDGDDPPMQYKMTPVLVRDGAFDAAEIEKRLADEGKGLPKKIRQEVLKRIEEYKSQCQPGH